MLSRALGHTDFQRLMTEHVKEATDWVICFGELSQFEWTKYFMPNMFREDMFQLCSRSIDDDFYGYGSQDLAAALDDLRDFCK